MTDAAARYRRWADLEARGFSATYERLALAVAADPGAVRFLDTVTERERQPNLLFAVLRWHGVDVHDPSAALAWLAEHHDDVCRDLSVRRTQTNEAARCATLLPALALLPQPIALIEVGASAGLTLLYDAWRYRYVGAGHDVWLGPVDSPVTLTCRVTGPVPLPAAVPTIVWRAGLDLNPLDPADPDTARWLACLVWPEHVERAGRLSAALAVASSSGRSVRQGDAVDDLAALVAQAPAGATVVVQHSATLTYLSQQRRAEFLTAVAALGVHRLGAEGGQALPHLRFPRGLGWDSHFVISLDDQALAYADPHGRSLDWL